MKHRCSCTLSQSPAHASQCKCVVPGAAAQPVACILSAAMMGAESAPANEKLDTPFHLPSNA